MISKRRRIRIAPAVIGFFALGTVLLAGGFLFGEELRGGASFVVAPLLRAERSFAEGLAGFFAQFSSRNELAEENRKLREERAESQILVLDRNRLYEENLELRERLGRVAEEVITAAVLLSPPSSPYDTLLLDVGERDQVSFGDKVAAGGTVLIGDIREVYTGSSRAVLYSAPGETREGFILPGNIPVTAEGLGGGALKARIPVGLAVAEGDTLSIPSVSPNIVASVVSMEHREGDSFEVVYFRMPVNPLTLRHVDVWRALR